MNEKEALNLSVKSRNEKEERTSEEILFCNLCTLHFKSKTEFNEHVDTHPLEKNENATLNLFKCIEYAQNIIEKKQKTPSNFMIYLEKYTCNKCDQVFQVVSDLMIHYSTKCLDAPFVCKHCKQNCYHINFLREHLIYYHKYTPEKLFKEGLIEDILRNPVQESRNSFLINAENECDEDRHHPELRHLADVEYMCGRNFIRKCDKRSLAFNLLIKPHMCEICHATFSRQCVLNNHVQTIHFQQNRMLMSNASGTNSPRKLRTRFGRSTIWKKVEPKNKYKALKNYRRRKDKKMNTNIFEITEEFSRDIDASAYKKIKLERKYERITISDEKNAAGSSKIKTSKRIKFRSTETISSQSKMDQGKNTDIYEIIKESSFSNSVSQLSDDGQDSTWSKIKLKRKIEKLTISKEKNNTNTSNMKMKLEQLKLKGTKTVSRYGAKKIQNSSNFNVAGLYSSTPTCNIDNKNKMNLRRRIKKNASDKQKEAATVPIKKYKKKEENEVKRRFTCEICLKQFKDGYKLRRHNFIHTGERPYACKICKKKFGRGDHLKRHLKKVCQGSNI